LGVWRWKVKPVPVAVFKRCGKLAMFMTLAGQFHKVWHYLFYLHLPDELISKTTFDGTLTTIIT